MRYRNHLSLCPSYLKTYVTLASWILLITCTLLLSVTAHAANDATAGNPAALSVYNQPPDLGKVENVAVAGSRVRSLPMRVGNLDVLSPFVSLLKSLDAEATQASTANLPKGTPRSKKNEFFQINVPGRVPIVMHIGHPVAYVGDKRQPLLAAPIYSHGQIWLPVFSLAPLLGASARIAADGTLHLNPTVRSVDISESGGNLVVTVTTSAPFPEGKVVPKVTSDPPRIYFDFPGFSMGFDANNSAGDRTVGYGKGDIARVRAGLFESFPDTTRVVLDLKKPLRPLAQKASNNKTFILTLLPSSATTTATIDTGTVAPPRGNGSIKGMTIVVDAGHGGKDSGARGAKSYEKQHTLDISKRLANYLQQMGAKVLLSRSDDTYVSLSGRTSFANARKADVFISVHLNSAGNRTAGGTETYYYTAQSRNLALEVHKQLSAATGLNNRGVKTARYYVLRNTKMPSILTESLFISNAREEGLMMQPSYRDKLARAMAQGIANYAKTYR